MKNVFIYFKYMMTTLAMVFYIYSMQLKAEESLFGLHATNIVDQNITIAWNDVSGEKEYIICITTFQSDGSTFTTERTIAADSTTFTATYLSEFTKHIFYVIAVYDNGNTTSDPLEATTTHHWSGDLLKYANFTLGYGYIDTHTPTKTELESINQFYCTFKNITDMEVVRDIQNATLLNLTHNNISVLPSWINELKNLETLNLSNNNIQGNIPENLWQLTNLQNLYLNNNQLSGMLSSNLNNLSSLKILFLNSNNLSGALPGNLNGLAWTLEWMFLDHNQFSGTIPDTIGDLSMLSILHLENNSFSNEIPTALNDLQYITVLSFDNNELNGTIPQWLGEKIWLGALYLSGNHFNGKIPADIAKLTHLDDEYGLKMDENDCLFSDGNSTLEAFIDTKASEFGGYLGIINSNTKCSQGLNFGIIPVINFILE